MKGTPLSARSIDGIAIARSIKAQTSQRVRELGEQGHIVQLDAVMVGDPSAGAIYARSQQSQCGQVGIKYRLHTLAPEATQEDLRAELHRLNTDPTVTGILLNLPLPSGIDTPVAQYEIDPYKDVEGVNPANIGLLFYDNPIIAPCTALAVMEILRSVDCCPRGMNAVVVGQGAIAGRPIALFLQHELATVTTCQIETRDIAEHTRQADILIVAVGKPDLIRAEHVKEGAVVIDVGINRVKENGTTKTVGDVRYEEVSEVASAITPVPGGVGPVTVAMLLRSASDAAFNQLGPRRINP